MAVLSQKSTEKTSVLIFLAKAFFKTATAESKYSAKNSDYTGQALKLNETYAAKNNYYMSDAFVGSADIRTAVGNLLNDVFNDQNAKTDDEIATLVNTKFQKAFESVTK